VLAEQILVEANNVNLALRKRAWTRRRGDRRALLGQAIEASLSALPVLANEPLIADTENHVRSSLERLGCNEQALLEEMRHDALILRMFINAESRLLAEMGVHAELITGVADALVDVIREATPIPDQNLQSRLQQLISELSTDLDAIRKEAVRDGTAARLAAALGVLGGSLVVAADSAAAVGSAGASAGLSGASIAAGSALVGQSLNEATSG
jgi:hypothetical protein